MDFPTVLARRSLLKASAFLALAATVPAVAAPVAENAVPEVLAMLLAEYSEAHHAQAKAREAYRNAEREFEEALFQARLPLPYQCGTGRQGGCYLGNLYSDFVDPWTAKHRLDNYRAATMARAKATGDQAGIDGRRRENRKLSARLSRQMKRYEIIKEAHRIPALDEVRNSAYYRAHDAGEALHAYRPTTFAELREIVRVVRKTPTYGSGLEWILVSMLEIETTGAI